MPPLIRYRTFRSRSRMAGSLRVLFRKWHDLLLWSAPRIGNGDEPDHPFWYGERTNIGWLALAAYEAGWLPIHEPTITRKLSISTRGKKRSKKVSGRSDLWIFKGRGNRQTFYDFEAKEADLSLESFLKQDKVFRFSKDIRRKLKSAVGDLRNKSLELQGDIGVGLVFMRLYLPRNRSRRAQEIALKRFDWEMTSGEHLKALKVDFVALHLAPYSLVRKIGAFYDDKYYDLGLGILGRMVRGRRF